MKLIIKKLISFAGVHWLGTVNDVEASPSQLPDLRGLPDFLTPHNILALKPFKCM